MGLPQWILKNMRTVIGIREFQFNADAGKEVPKLAPGSGQLSVHAVANNSTVTVISVPARTKLIFAFLRFERVGGTVSAFMTYNGGDVFGIGTTGTQVIQLEGSIERPVFSLVNTTAAPLLLEVVTANADTLGIADASYAFVDALPTAPA
jgi:hypothetical protein